MIFWRTKCDILFCDETLIYYMLFTCWENGVLQLVSEPGWSVRPSSWAVCVVWRLNTVIVFSYYCLLCREQRMRYIFEEENILSGESCNALFYYWFILSSLVSFFIYFIWIIAMCDFCIRCGYLLVVYYDITSERI